MGEGWRSQFADLLCGYSMSFWYLLWFNVVFLLLGLFAWQYSSPGTVSRLILQVDLVLNGGLILSIGAILGYCRRHR